MTVDRRGRCDAMRRLGPSCSNLRTLLVPFACVLCVCDGALPDFVPVLTYRIIVFLLLCALACSHEQHARLAQSARAQQHLQQRFLAQARHGETCYESHAVPSQPIILSMCMACLICFVAVWAVAVFLRRVRADGIHRLPIVVLCRSRAELGFAHQRGVAAVRLGPFRRQERSSAEVTCGGSQGGCDAHRCRRSSGCRSESGGQSGGC